MSTRRDKKIRALVYHCEYGGNVPAMLRSQAKLKAMGLTDRQYRRAECLASKKCTKEAAKYASWEAAGCRT